MASKHAGVAAGDPSVTVPLETGLRVGLAEAGNVRSRQDYQRLMTSASRSAAGPGWYSTSSMGATG
jgi:hypothetical protein